MARFDKEAVRAAAGARWPSIIAALTHTSIDLLDGEHHPCPKCGGENRFNLARDGSGGSFCNQCPAKNSDGFATIAWLSGMGFADVLEAVANECGIKPKQQKRDDPAKNLEFLPWVDSIASLWCLKKPGVSPQALVAIGARRAKYRDQFNVFAIPVWGEFKTSGTPVGWVLYRTDGGMLPRMNKAGQVVEQLKVKNTGGSKRGMIMPVDLPRRSDRSRPLWKTEGPTDLLALLTAAPGTDAFTTANGSKEEPSPWMVEAVTDRTIYIVHDADEPGQEGATWIPESDGRRKPGWAPHLAKTAQEVRNVTLPFPLEKTHGQDIRDYFTGGSTFADLLERAQSAEVFKAEDTKAEVDAYINEDDDDPQRLARINLKNYQDNHGGRLIYWRDEWWKWKAGSYRRIDGSELKAKVWAAIRAEFERCWKASNGQRKVQKVTRPIVSNVIGAMESIAAIPSSIQMPCWIPTREQRHYIAMENGILDLDAVFDGKEAAQCLREHSPDWFSSFRLDYRFDPEADCPLWRDYLDYTMEGDQERIDLLQEWAGYLLTNSNDLQRFLVLEGEGGNGKTVFFAAMTAMLGQDNVSHVPVENFGGRFDLGITLGKAANISGDVGEIESIAEGILKQFTGGDVMMFDRKNKLPISARPTAKLMASWNVRPRIKDRSRGLWRRMLVVPFNREIPPDRKVYGMDNADWWVRQGEAPGILMWAIVGLDRLKQQGTFTMPEVSMKALQEYREDSNPAMRFLRETVAMLPPERLEIEIQKDPAEQEGIRCDELYSEYREWCSSEGIQPLSKQNLGKQVRRQFGDLKNRRGGRGDRFFVYRLLRYADPNF